MNWFEGITTIREADKLKRALANRLHPDKGGSAEYFREMLEQYNELVTAIRLRRSHITAVIHSPAPRDGHHEAHEETGGDGDSNAVDPQWHDWVDQGIDLLARDVASIIKSMIRKR